MSGTILVAPPGNAQSPLATEIARRRTFAIISHPDAGKTTLTEKLLLYGGAIGLAGSVRARRNQRATTSDWMALEQQRGISVNSTVLQFPYRGYQLNLLDTPGHQDFSEDTYRTLAAVDSAVMVIDAAKGVEPQTRKLFQVCRMRGIPIFTFINKLDRPARDPLELLDEIEEVLGIDAAPLNWPIGDGPSFQGVYDRQDNQVHVFERSERGQHVAPVQTGGLHDPGFERLIGEIAHDRLRESVALLQGAGAAFDVHRVSRGEQTPVFFGSALTNFGLELFLERFLELAPPPLPRQAGPRTVQPHDSEFSGFIFKVQANMDPLHRDSVAFLRVCSGRFERDMTVLQSRTGKKLRLSRSHRAFARERETVDEAFPGDVIGLTNSGQFAIGDTLCTGSAIQFEPLPRFQPEHFAALSTANSGKHKQFQKGLRQLVAEGAVQQFSDSRGLRSEPILGAVGPLQFDVVRFRLQTEYGVDAQVEMLPYEHARWLEGSASEINRLPWGRGTRLVEDDRGQPVALFDSSFSLRYWMEHYPGIGYHELSSEIASARTNR